MSLILRHPIANRCFFVNHAVCVWYKIMVVVVVFFRQVSFSQIRRSVPPLLRSSAACRGCTCCWWDPNDWWPDHQYVYQSVFPFTKPFLNNNNSRRFELFFFGNFRLVNLTWKIAGLKSIPGWWFGTFFAIYWEESSQLTFIFFRGVGLNHQPDKYQSL